MTTARPCCGGSPEKAIDDLIAWQMGYAGAAGFLSNIGRLITMPVAVPQISPRFF